MNMRGGMNEVLRQAARLQRKVELAKEGLKDQEVAGEALGGKVKATVSLGGKVKNIDFQMSMVEQEGAELVRDAICAAINAGLELANKTMEAEVEKVTGGMKIPGL
jgi:DNA-binding protein YbaB